MPNFWEPLCASPLLFSFCPKHRMIYMWTIFPQPQFQEEEKWDWPPANMEHVRSHQELGSWWEPYWVLENITEQVDQNTEVKQMLVQKADVFPESYPWPTQHRWGQGPRKQEMKAGKKSQENIGGFQKMSTASQALSLLLDFFSSLLCWSCKEHLSLWTLVRKWSAWSNLVWEYQL